MNSVHFTPVVHFVNPIGYTNLVVKQARREREKAEFREEVLAAARAIVLEEGYAALTMRKIADVIEYAPGTIYLYFESRDAIAFELCRRGFEALYDALSPVASVADPEERIRELGRRYVTFGMENPETYRLIFMEDPNYASALFEEQSEDPHSPGMRSLGLLVSAFSEARQQQRLKVDVAPDVLAEMIWASVHGIVALKISYDRFPRAQADELLDAQTEVLLDGLFVRSI